MNSEFFSTLHAKTCNVANSKNRRRAVMKSFQSPIFNAPLRRVEPSRPPQPAAKTQVLSK